jgi:hypothetical protein
MATNLLPRIALALALSLAGPTLAEDPAPQSGAGEALPPLPEEQLPPAPDPNPVPNGAKEDKALWISCDEVANQLASARYEGAHLHWRIKAEDLYARLQAAAKADPGVAKRVEEVRQQLLEAHTSSYGDLAGRWPIDKTRTCRYQQLDLGSAMEVSVTRDNRPQLAEAREAASRCLELARSTAKRVQGSSAALARALAAVEKVLPPPPQDPAAK